MALLHVDHLVEVRVRVRVSVRVRVRVRLHVDHLVDVLEVRAPG